MKLNSSDGSDLMEVENLRSESGNLIVVGTIMGAVPIEAVLTPKELRKAFGLINFRLVMSILKMLLSK